MRHRNCKNIPIQKQVLVVLDYLDHMPYREIERKYGIGESTAYAIAKRFGATPRQPYFSEAAREARHAHV